MLMLHWASMELQAQARAGKAIADRSVSSFLHIFLSDVIVFYVMMPRHISAMLSSGMSHQALIFSCHQIKIGVLLYPDNHIIILSQGGKGGNGNGGGGEGGEVPAWCNPKDPMGAWMNYIKVPSSLFQAPKESSKECSLEYRVCSSSGSNIRPSTVLFRFESGASLRGSQSTVLTVATVWKGAGERSPTTNLNSSLTTMQ